MFSYTCPCCHFNHSSRTTIQRYFVDGEFNSFSNLQYISMIANRRTDTSTAYAVLCTCFSYASCGNNFTVKLKDDTETVQVTPLRTLASSSQPECASCRQQGYVNNKTFLQQNLLLLNCAARVTQIVPYNGRETVVVVVVVVCSSSSSGSSSGSSEVKENQITVNDDMRYIL